MTQREILEKELAKYRHALELCREALDDSETNPFSVRTRDGGDLLGIVESALGLPEKRAAQ